MEKVISKVEEWEKSNIQVFWGEIAPCDHLVQIYENDKIFLDTLEGFAGTGFLANESVIIIATSNHLSALNSRLVAQGFNLDALAATGQYFPIDVNDVFPKILINDWLDEKRFDSFVSNLINRAKKDNRKVRTFGELVAVLWAQGHCGVTVQMEHLWHQLYHKYTFTLYCAYPKVGFTQSAKDSIDTICKKHSKIIDGQSRPATDIYYKTA